jgi:exopolyphosphatase/guanosine-5'-triphosphate,3'-diphosphate pyrophosphatase
MPQAEGLVADMGGGSLELVRIGQGTVHERVSLPLGAMRVASIRAGGTGRLRKALRGALEPLEWARQCAGQPLYLVGGSWRTLARVHMHLTGWPLPVLGNYVIPAEEARTLKLQVRELGTARMLEIGGVSQSRVLQLDDAAALLAALAGEIAPGSVVVSTFGLREGLLYQDLAEAERARDPLIEGVQHIVGGQTQVPGYAEALLGWSDGAFPDEPEAERRLRHAACLIAGTGWASNPDFRVIEAEEMALHGSWIGLDAADRAVMAMALHVGLGGDPLAPPAILTRLAPPARLDRARAWGFALRLAQRLGGGSPRALARLPLRREADGGLVLAIPPQFAALADARVERRLARLALALGTTGTIES